jgi:hypothetical protein
VIGQYVWPNYYVGQTYEDEINYLKNWLSSRLIWMDNQLITDVEEDLSENELDFVLYQNFPNPFNPSTTIKYSIKKQTNVSIKLFDVLGNELATLVNEFKYPGVYSINLDAEKIQLSSGVYFYSMKAGEFTSTKKLILIK